MSLDLQRADFRRRADPPRNPGDEVVLVTTEFTAIVTLSAAERNFQRYFDLLFPFAKRRSAESPITTALFRVRAVCRGAFRSSRVALNDDKIGL